MIMGNGGQSRIEENIIRKVEQRAKRPEFWI
jgi:hypothetical protein